MGKQGAARETFNSKRGFILACIGSAVGMGNIWLFPTRISAYGGATFLIPYLIFVLLIASTGVIGEMAFGRATKSGPIGAFAQATKARFGTELPGKILGLLPVLSSLCMAIGYSIVVGWIFTYAFESFAGTTLALPSVDAFAGHFGGIAADNSVFQTISMVAAVIIMALGVVKGIERLNFFLMPLFFLMFIGLAVYTATLPGAAEGYRYVFLLDPAGLADPMVWVYALGQAFFSLSIAGNGTLIYGSYLSPHEDVPQSAKYVALFDTLAAVVASLVIIPAMASAGQTLDTGGPGLMFIFLPHLFANMPGGAVFQAVFFCAVLIGGFTSLVNLFEAPIATLQERFALTRRTAVLSIGGLGLVAGLLIQAIVADWMDVLSVFFCPLGALIAAVMFYWLFTRERVEHEVNLGRRKPLGAWFYPLAKYVFCPIVLVVLVVGAVMGGIG
ncbi:sodium-dependent transporter [Eggerthellaceae bacterium zg-1084]|uniref:Sodium-dependent transporter n=1 Tax=Berryella wangjianweii TaxID=2734634 RepID=A0A6M8IW25_9ACTN|nr:sodium-dependent transporter [Berryella wangjianweii]NPD31303.1 sodium-dependent transporter [Berryella wangjianweii]NPD32388.1 sodium-dependent transporter [Eggerthellaceae bacterium zg-997]QKF06845.1 sodium-dependent transporter [Berryella wangjianweii]